MPDVEASNLVRQWTNGLRIEHISHSRAAAVYERRRWLLGAAAALLSAVVGTSVFASLAHEVEMPLRVIVGLLAVLAAILTALNSFLNYAERVEQHSISARLYGGLRRELELLTRLDPDPKLPDLSKLNARWQEVDSASPKVSNAIHDWARTRVSTSDPAT